MDPPLRETMLVRGDVDAITGFTFTSLLNLEARGVKAEDIAVLPYPITASSSTATPSSPAPGCSRRTPAAVKAFLQRLHQGRQGGDGQPRRGHRLRQGSATASSTSTLEARRLRLAIDTVVNTPTRAPRASASSCPRAWR
jgi:NitT/TauT family transport system substrate-binding protein